MKTINWFKLPVQPRHAWLYFLMFGGAYSVLCLFGVLTADNKILSLLWPANPFMLGMLVRFPLLAHPLGWLACLGRRRWGGHGQVMWCRLAGGHILVVAQILDLFLGRDMQHMNALSSLAGESNEPLCRQ